MSYFDIKFQSYMKKKIDCGLTTVQVKRRMIPLNAFDLKSFCLRGFCLII